jgi:hypothetical protein
MTVARTARRRRIQARNDWRHLARLGRPHFKKPNLAASQKREAQKREKMLNMQARRARRK